MANTFDLTDIIQPPMIFDSYYSGSLDQQGQIIELWGKDALSNALKMWIASYRGEILRAPTTGGYVLSNLLKPMKSEITLDILKGSIMNGLENDFRPYLKIIKFNIVPNFSANHYDFFLEAFCQNLQLTLFVQDKLKILT